MAVEINTNNTSSSSSGGSTNIEIKTGFSSQVKYKFVGECDLSTIPEDEIFKDIAKRMQNKRRLIIPIGLPNSGKSMFIASLIAYAFRRAEKDDNSCNFEHVSDLELSGIQSIIDDLDNQKTLGSTHRSHFSIIDLDMISNYRKNKKIKVSLLDFAGEDILRLLGRMPDDQNVGYKIGRILDACIVQKAIFAILTPVDENFTELGDVSEFDKNEDTIMKGFIDRVKSHNPKLYQKTKFLMVVTKSDKLSDKTATKVFLKEHRNQLYNEYSSNSKSYGLIRYSVGEVMGDTIMDIKLRSPKNFWYTLYRWCTGMHVLPWWIRIFS